ncbi:universal stress protein [Paenibacillus sp. GCM10027628]|uniref:universal stress protein n=1 Tax=Paenibacillus sp. GCM10027628 TaxID=3273413 RepID=UPI00362FC33F
MFCSKVLVAFDGSELSEKALGRAALIAKRDPQIAVKVLVVRPQMQGDSMYALIDESLFDSDAVYWDEIVNKVEHSLSQFKNSHSVTLIQGSPQTEILRFAEKQKCDLILMGSRGLTGIKELLLGSVSHYVVQHAKIPVLIEK